MNILHSERIIKVLLVVTGDSDRNDVERRL